MEREEGMIEITFRVPPAVLRSLAGTAAEVLRGGETRMTGAEETLTVSEENGGFQEDVFRRLARDMEEHPETRRVSGGEQKRELPAETAEAGPEMSTEEETSQRRGERREELSGEREGAGDPSLPPPPRRESGGPEIQEAVTLRRGSGELGRWLSAPEPATYAVERSAEGSRRGESREDAGEPAIPGAETLTAEELSQRWERDSRRYDGDFTLY